MSLTYELTVVNKTSTVKLDSSDTDISKHTLFRIKLDTFNLEYRVYLRFFVVISEYQNTCSERHFF